MMPENPPSLPKHLINFWHITPVHVLLTLRLSKIIKKVLIFASYNLPVCHLMYCPYRETVNSTTLRNTRPTLLDVTSKRSAKARAGFWLAILHRNVRICFYGAMTCRRDEFVMGICPVRIISREKSSQVSLVIRKWCLNSLGKYLGRVSSK